MNLPTKLTVSRIILSVIVMVLLMFPFEAIGFSFPVIRAGVDISSQYVIAGVLFIIASVTDFFDGYLARKLNAYSRLGKYLDAVSDKMYSDNSSNSSTYFPGYTISFSVNGYGWISFQAVRRDRIMVLKVSHVKDVRNWDASIGVCVILLEFSA